jgi:hypothetical protein
MTLAQNAVRNKRLTEYADELDRYIAFLEKQEKENSVEEILDNEQQAE